MSVESRESSATEHTVENSRGLGDRDRPDACPGAVHMHRAADGQIGRIRVPGGYMEPGIWETLADLSDSYGDGAIHLTTRGNLQIRGISETNAADFTGAVDAAGLLPSITHDRIRNIIAAPLSPELVPLVRELDRLLLDDPTTARLSGRTLFGIDDGSGMIAARRPDIGVLPDDGLHHLILGGCSVDAATKPGDTARALARAAALWAARRGKSWRIDEQPGAASGIVANLTGSGLARTVPAPSVPVETPDPPIGWIDRPDGTVSLAAGLRFGALDTTLARMIATIGRPTQVTCWRSVIIEGLDTASAEVVVKVLAPMGLIFDADSPWLEVSACTGSTGCDKSASDTRADAVSAVREHRVPAAPGDHVHFSGCERRCGHPVEGPYTDYLAVGEGEYEVGRRSGKS
ncbi:precorrin-3B synthase [Corynebacterium sp. CCM 9185]|uniref:Precorrin-3B synthase n=1 Tax=Corynebacterium marambiense TaxID=2765364 RepID=A0ABS0VYF1_9CORY|nr:precorrin-3B synthase [Corynebacterium marambiense]MBI9000423.1 precorrin-3B synthase [Corynebacterium marambiense]MCK7664176.1 precorrin-3B synthase [Corynebacterium marambiense]